MALGYRYYAGPDRAYYKNDLRRLAAGDRVITLIEGINLRVVTMDAQKYWMHRDSALDATHPSFWLAFEDKLNAIATNTYRMDAWTPTGSTLAYSGLKLQRTAGSTAFSYDWGNSSLDPRLFGFAHDVSGTTSHIAGQIYSPLSMFGKFQSPWRASLKRPDDSRTILESAPSVQAASVDFGPEPARFWRYTALWAAHVHRYAADEPALADKAGLPAGDTHNALAWLWWQGATDDILLVHGYGDQDLLVDPATAGDERQYEIARLDASYQGMSRLRQALSAYEGAERYDVDLRLWIKGGEFRH